MNGDVSVWLETAQQTSKAYCFSSVAHTLRADEVDQKNANAVSTDDDLGNDTVYCLNSDLQSNIDELAGLVESDSDTKFEIL